MRNRLIMLPGRISSLAVASALTLAACGGQRDAAPAPPAATPAAAVPPVVDYTAVDYAYQGPDTIPSGWVTIRLRSTGTELHHGSLFRLTGGKTLADLASLGPTDPFPAWLEAAGGPQAPAPGSYLENTVKLEPGSYALICLIPSPDGKPHVMRGMAKPITVVPSSIAAQPPVADIDVTLSDFVFALSKPLTAGKHTLRVTATPGQPHEIVIARLAPGKKAEDFLAWVEKMAGPPPVEAIVGGTTALAGSAENVFTLDLTPGNYALICFIPDVKDGKPHAVHGMMQTIPIS